MVRPSLHSPQTILSSRHMPSWFLLCGAAGLTNAMAFLAVSRFVSHLTGTVTNGGMDVGWGQWLLMGEYALVVCCFVVGAFAAVVLTSRKVIARENVVHGVPLLLAAALIAATALLGAAGVFGPVGGSTEEPSDFLFLCLLSTAMGLQNAAVAHSTGMLVRTTHLTGPATDLGVNLAIAQLSEGEARRLALRSALLRAGKLVSFALGAGLMVPLCARFGYLALLLPAAVIVVATGLSFVRSWANLPPSAVATR